MRVAWYGPTTGVLLQWNECLE